MSPFAKGHKGNIHPRQGRIGCDNHIETTPERAERLKAIAQHAPRSLGVFRDTYRGKSRKAGVKAFCIECQGFEDPAETVRTCTAYACPLWEYRPYRGKTGKKESP